MKIMGFLMVLILAGCVNVTREYPAKQHYALKVKVPPGAGFRHIPGTVLKVREFQELPRYQGREFVYRQSDVRYATDFYNVFMVAPGAILAEETGEWLACRGPFERLVDSTSRVRNTHLLEGTLVVLEGDYRRKEDPQAVMAVSLTVINDLGPVPMIVFQGNYARSVALSNATPDTLVMGWNAALSEILADFENDLMRTNFTGLAASSLTIP